jgi:uncharacterized protein (DUF1330 family)
MSAYLIAEVQVRDAAAYSQYKARTPAIIARYGGRFIVRGGTVETLEGEPRNRRIVIVEFSSMEAARAFYNSPEYQEAKDIRTAASDAHFVIVAGAG